jgi:hypothetical protein
VSKGAEIFVFEDGAYRLVFGETRREGHAGFNALAALSKEGRLEGMSAIDAAHTAYIVDSRAPRSFDRAKASAAGVVIDVGDAVPAAAGKPITDLHRGYLRAIAAIGCATAALRESRLAEPPQNCPDVGDTALWTFDQPRFPAGCRLRVRVGGSGFVHAGVSAPDGAWNPIYKVPLVVIAHVLRFLQHAPCLPANLRRPLSRGSDCLRRARDRARTRRISQSSTSDRQGFERNAAQPARFAASRPGG